MWAITRALAGVALVLGATDGLAQVPETITARSNMVNREVTFKVDLDIPEGGGPFPAVVLMHGCGGLSPSRAPFNWRKVFREMGYATMIIESFTPRGWPANICTKEPEVAYAGQNDRRAEAQAAAKMLRKLPFIKRDAIVLMGFSHGAGTSMFVAQRTPGVAASYDDDQRSEQFNALIAAYPWCGTPNTELQFQAKPVPIPLLILAGDQDAVTPAEFCRRYTASRAPISDGNVELRLYSGAAHSFDSSLPLTVATLCGGLDGKCGLKAFVGHHEPSFQQAQKDVAAFLKAKLP